MAKYLCKIWNVDRTHKKAFMSLASIDLVIQKANYFSLFGSKLVLECDGTEVDDDETLEAFLQEKTTLIILNSREMWRPINATTTPAALVEQYQQENVDSITISSEEAHCSPLTQSLTNNVDVIPNWYALAQSSPIQYENDTIEYVLDQSSSNLHLQNNGLGGIPSYADKDDANTSSRTDANTTNRTPQATCDLFNNFEIPWNKMSPEIIKALKEKKKLGKLLNMFCNVVVNELRPISLYIPMSVYRNISRMAANKYPESFVERDGQGNVMSHIPISVITIMRNRNNFLNSASQNRSKRSAVRNNKRKTFSVFSRSVVNWQPENSAENIEDITSKKQFLLSMHYKKKLQPFEEENVKKFMGDCFAAQRIFFNDSLKIPTVQDILRNWPMIFHKECLFQHFQKLMELDIRIFKTNFIASDSKFKEFFKIDENGDAEAIIKAICNYFKENATLFLKKFKFGTTVCDVKQENELVTPWISIIETSLPEEGKSISYIWLEGEITAMQEKFEIADLILQLICYYYIFNIEYPRDISQTCEFLMRYLFKFYPSQIRGQKKHVNNLKKINALIAKLDKV